MITLQALFNKMWRGLKAQGWQKAYQHGGCEYLTEDGKKCAVGQCLTDPGSVPFGNVCNALTDSVEVRRDLGFPEDRTVYNHCDPSDDRLQFLRQAQSAHDGAKSPELMQRALRLVGANFGLTVPDDGEASP